MKIKKILWILSVTLILFACVDSKQKVERISDIPYIVLTDSLYTRMPGDLFLQGRHVVWIDPFSSENFVHVLDASSGRELGSFGNKGNGPHEFTDILATMTYDSLLMLCDLNRNFQGYVDLHKIGIDTSAVFLKWKQDKLGDPSRYLEIGEGQSLAFCPGATSPFIYKQGNDVDSVGNFPFSEKIINGYNIYQGEILYNPDRKCVLYSTYKFPYVAMYKFDNGKLVLDWEKRESVDYRVVDGRLKLEKKINSFHEMALSKDYIVVSKYDEETERVLSEDEKQKEDLLHSLPYSLFLYDYSFNLKKIIKLEAPIIRIAGSIHSNTLCAIIVNPEFSIIKLELPN